MVRRGLAFCPRRRGLIGARFGGFNRGASFSLFRKLRRESFGSAPTWSYRRELGLPSGGRQSRFRRRVFRRRGGKCV